MQLAGKVAVITGGASGIGRGTALAMARRGSDLVIADINDRRLEETRAAIATLGRRALVVHCDVSNDADVERLGATALREMGHVDIVMNNAGVVLRGARHPHVSVAHARARQWSYHQHRVCRRADRPYWRGGTLCSVQVCHCRS